ncbi:hypothetical protein C4561_00715 [candidate division WWE3 bacterium]|uniref:Uncharacterized protein n=1 Tax=candidate division WWE3 bacterium TaxID=2053526 RepID=A0A3A4ZG49_UNCKA|nr:MAG: hypothetical protein C4561_00715 [candidate division WWE3 bacterium]
MPFNVKLTLGFGIIIAQIVLMVLSALTLNYSANEYFRMIAMSWAGLLKFTLLPAIVSGVLIVAAAVSDESRKRKWDERISRKSHGR